LVSPQIDYRHVRYEWRAAPVDPPAGFVPGAAVDVFFLVEGDRQFFQRFTPIDRIGYSIFICRFTEAEAAAAATTARPRPLTATGRIRSVHLRRSGA
jgi:hypothetical protein